MSLGQLFHPLNQLIVEKLILNDLCVFYNQFQHLPTH